MTMLREWLRYEITTDREQGTAPEWWFERIGLYIDEDDLPSDQEQADLRRIRRVPELERLLFALDAENTRLRVQLDRMKGGAA